MNFWVEYWKVHTTEIGSHAQMKEQIHWVEPDPNIISKIGKSVGTQSVIIVLDVKKKKFSNDYDLYTHNGKKKTGLNVLDFAKKIEELGCGEIIINSIDQDGVMEGYDTNIINIIAETF